MSGAVALGSMVTIGGCSLALDPGEQQCSTSEDCVSSGYKDLVCSGHVCQRSAATPDAAPTADADAGPPPDPIWGCLGHVPKPTWDSSQLLHFTLTLNYLDKSPVADATVDVCDISDVTCTGTDPRYPKGLKPDGAGNVAIAVLQGFDGFIWIRGPDVMESRFYVGQPLLQPPTIKILSLIKPKDYPLILNLAHQTVDLTRGSAIFFVADCSAHAASGVKFSSPEADDKSKLFYLVNALPLLPPGISATDVEGFGGFFNLPEGSAAVEARRASDDAFVGRSSFVVSPNSISFVYVTPSPI